MDELEQAQEMAQLTGAEFPLLADPQREAITPYGVYNLLGDGVAAPATFIIDGDGVVQWMHVGRDIADRPTPQALLQQLETLHIG
jgi:peroxiredoxin